MTLQLDGKYTYTPPPDNWRGADTFTIQADDGFTLSNIGTITIHVTSAAVDVEYAVAMNQTFEVSAGVGLLTDLYEAWSANFEIASITTDDGTFSINETITFLSGAETTRSADGSFVFIPAGDFTGTETFTFTAAYGEETEHTTIYLAVVDPAAAEPDEEEWSLTTEGTLVYTSSEEVSGGSLAQSSFSSVQQWFTTSYTEHWININLTYFSLTVQRPSVLIHFQIWNPLHPRKSP